LRLRWKIRYNEKKEKGVGPSEKDRSFNQGLCRSQCGYQSRCANCCFLRHRGSGNNKRLRRFDRWRVGRTGQTVSFGYLEPGRNHPEDSPGQKIFHRGRAIADNDIDGLIVIGGDGSLTGAHVLATKYDVPVIGVPATIDNDINGVDMSIGADTAVNVAVEALDKIKDTATSLERVFIVEVMGRDCGYIALQVALAGGCEEVLIPEKKTAMAKVCADIVEGSRQGKMSWIVIVAEGSAKGSDVAGTIVKKTGMETRLSVLGYIQRGGVPTAFDRLLAARLGSHAVELLLEGQTDKCVSLKDNRFLTIPLETAIQPKKIDYERDYRLIKILT